MRHPVIHLPPLSAEQTSHLLVWLEYTATAICRAHGAAVINYRLSNNEQIHPHPFDDDHIPCFCPRHPERHDEDEPPPPF
ncbi:MAG: hypothetical protein U0166_19545 [Acidobacteriota bacterium]